MIYEHLIFIILSINSGSFMSHFKKRFKEFKYFWKIKKKNFKYNLIFKFTKFALKQKHKILVKLVIYTYIYTYMSKDHRFLWGGKARRERWT